jgi:hypothetical protein
MIEYGTPVCSESQRPAKFFCYTDNCTLPTFICHSDEFANHKHKSNGRINLWGAAFPEIREVIERELSQKDIEAFDRQ